MSGSMDDMGVYVNFAVVDATASLLLLLLLSAEEDSRDVELSDLIMVAA